MKNILLIAVLGLLCSCSTTGYVIDKHCANEEIIVFTISNDKDTFDIETELNRETLEIDYYDRVKVKNGKITFLEREI